MKGDDCPKRTSATGSWIDSLPAPILYPLGAIGVGLFLLLLFVVGIVDLLFHPDHISEYKQALTA